MIGSTANWRRDRGQRFYRIAALLALVVAFAGFFLTYVKPMAQGRFEGPAGAHLHGALLASWLILVAIQSFLLPSHRWLGWIAVALAPAIAASTIAIGVAATRRDLAQGFVVGMAGNVTTSLVFCGLIGAALIFRRKPQWHKRLILIATVVLLWPAWFRWRHFLPWVPRPDLTLGLVAANAPILIAMLRDWRLFGAIHPAYLRVGIPVIAWETFEALAFSTPVWTEVSMWFYQALA